MNFRISRKKLVSAVTALLVGTGLAVTGAAWASDSPTADPPGVQSDGHSVDLAQVPSKMPALNANGDQLRDINGNALCVAMSLQPPIGPPSKEDLQSRVTALLLEGGSITIGDVTWKSPTKELMDEMGADTNTESVSVGVVTPEITAVDAVRC